MLRDLAGDLTRAVVDKFIKMLKGFMIGILLALKMFFSILKIGLLLVGFIIKIFLSMLKAVIPK